MKKRRNKEIGREKEKDKMNMSANEESDEHEQIINEHHHHEVRRITQVSNNKQEIYL